MNPDEWLQEQFEREIERLRSLYPGVAESKELEQAEEDGPMSWEEAMSEPLYYNLDLDVGGELEIKINHDTTPGYSGLRISK